MSPQGAGSGNTPERLKALIVMEVEKSSQSAVARATGLTQSAIGRYSKGIGEPTTATLQKLADYFGVTVAWLRGGGGKTPPQLVKLLKDANEKGLLKELGIKGALLSPVTVELLLRGDAEPNEAILNKLAEKFDVSVPYLRSEAGKGSTTGNANGDADVFIEQLSGLIELYNMAPDRLKECAWLALCTFRDLVAEGLAFHGPNIDEVKLAQIQKILQEADAIVGIWKK